MANSLISMIKGDSTLIDNTEVLDGQLLLDETNKKIYLDDNNERIDFSQGGGETSSDANLAYVEEGTVATRGYAAGAYVIVEGQLYKTLTQINSGTTFITEGVNANVEATNIGSEVTQLNNDLSDFSFRNNSGIAQYSMDDGSTWVNFKNPTGTKSITANGTYDVTDYASASVNVKPTYTKYGPYSTNNNTIYCNSGDIIVFTGVYESWVLSGVQKLFFDYPTYIGKATSTSVTFNGGGSTYAHKISV